MIHGRDGVTNMFLCCPFFPFRLRRYIQNSRPCFTLFSNTSKFFKNNRLRINNITGEYSINKLRCILSNQTFIWMIDPASRRNTVLPETSSVPAKKSTAGSLKRVPYRAPDEQQPVTKHPRITIHDDGKTRCCNKNVAIKSSFWTKTKKGKSAGKVALRQSGIDLDFVADWLRKTISARWLVVTEHRRLRLELIENMSVLWQKELCRPAVKLA